MIKLKVLNPFFDVELGEKRLRNTEFECSKKRAKEILKHEPKLVEILAITKNV